METYYSSFSLGMVAYVAHIKQNCLFIPFLILYGTSILHHAKYNDQYTGKYIIYLVDKLIAHTTVASTCVMAISIKNIMIVPLSVYWFCLIWMIYVFYIGKKSHLPGDKWKPWHASLHIAASIGTISLLMHY